MDQLRAQLLILLMGLPLIVAAMVSDVRRRRLPNSLTVSLAVLAIGLHTITSGWAGLGSSLGGLAIGFAVMLPFVIFHLLGAGDLKFMAALGALVGHQWVLAAAAAGVLLGGLCSLIAILGQKREIAAQRWALIAAKISSLKMLNSDFASHESLATTQRAVPYGVYLGIGAIGVDAYQVYNLMNGA